MATNTCFEATDKSITKGRQSHRSYAAHFYHFNAYFSENKSLSKDIFVFSAVALYSEPSGEMVCMFEGQQGGVTQIKFSPDGSKLYSGGRKVSFKLFKEL